MKNKKYTKFMKTKLFVLAAAIFAAASLSAQAGVFVSIRLPLPRIVVAAPAPVVVAPAPVVVSPVAPAPVIVAAPPCPAAGYVWVPGYWGTGHVWVAGCWRPGPHVVVHAHGYAWHRW